MSPNANDLCREEIVSHSIRMDDRWMVILKKQLNWLEGFAAALDNRHLLTWVASMGETINRINRGEPPGPSSRDLHPPTGGTK